MVRLADKLSCTGCESCAEICAKGAISMQMDEEGFLYPKIDTRACVNCGRCAQVCPVLNFRNIDDNPICYAGRSSDRSLVNKSSSGGIFSELALCVLNKNGVVIGAAYDNKDLSVRHIVITSKAELCNLRGAKYVQSRILGIYIAAKEFLDKGLDVLFSGTPCQIAGLKAYLRKDYKNLLTVDLICHGVPPIRLYEQLLKYLRDAHGDVKSVSFRDKAHGWRARAITGCYEDGIKIREEDDGNIYLKAFLEHLSLRPCCEACKFNNGQSGSDITLGDFWGIRNEVQEFDDDQGVSAIIVHSQKGLALLSSRNIEHKLVNLEQIARHNPSYRQARVHDYRRQTFLKLAYKSGMTIAYKTAIGIRKPLCYRVMARLIYSFKRMFRCPPISYGRTSQTAKRSVGISTVGLYYLLANYGSFYQHYALRTILSDLGYNPFRLARPDEKPGSQLKKYIVFILKIVYIWIMRKGNVKSFISNSLYRFKIEHLFINDFVKLNGSVYEMQALYDNTIGIKGGDQVFVPAPPESWLHQIHQSNPRIAYGVSTAWKTKRNDILWVDFIKAEMKNFSSVGIREKEGVECVRKLVGQGHDIVQVADPVQLLTVKQYEVIESKKRVFEKPTCFCYLLNISEASRFPLKQLVGIAEKLGCQLKILGIQGTESLVPKEYAVLLSPRSFLRAIREARYIITNSFHGTLFSIIYHKQFLFLKQAEGLGDDANSRQTELLDRSNLQIRGLGDLGNESAAINVLKSPCDWEVVDSRCEEFRHKSIEWLWASLHRGDLRQKVR